MKKVSLWSLIILLALLLYLVFTMLFATVFQEISERRAQDTPTPAPTFTPTAPTTPVTIVTPATATPTNSPPTATPSPTVEPSATSIENLPQITAASVVNMRAGPGLNYAIVGTLPVNRPVSIIGRSQDGDWWQVSLPDGTKGWVADWVVTATATEGVPVAMAPPTPTSPPAPTRSANPDPTATPEPRPTDPPAKPAYQYEPTGWYGDVNYGLTRFLGTITDVDGNPVNGVFIEAKCGDFSIISNPSGPVGWGPFNESHTWSPGFYDITLDNKPIVCKWELSVVETPDRKTVTARLSESVPVETTVDESIITANWQKNW